jgi:hypothetical protein
MNVRGVSFQIDRLFIAPQTPRREAYEKAIMKRIIVILISVNIFEVPLWGI